MEQKAFPVVHVKGNGWSRPHRSSEKEEEDTDSRKCLIVDSEGQRKIKATYHVSVLDEWLDFMFETGKVDVYCVL